MLCFISSDTADNRGVKGFIKRFKGHVAHLVAHLLCTQEAVGSKPAMSMKNIKS